VSRTSESAEAPGRLLGGLGLAARAGRVRVGADAVGRSIRNREAALVVIAGDAPQYVRRKIERLLSSRSLPHVVVLDGDQLGRAVGRERVVTLAVTDESLGRRVLELAERVAG
jgi:ribosomal protein L7Ae-like RNA K-turn-binding protein